MPGEIILDEFLVDLDEQRDVFLVSVFFLFCFVLGNGSVIGNIIYSVMYFF